MTNSKNLWDGLDHWMIYKADGRELSIDRIIRKYETVWWEVRVAQHSETAGTNACWHIYIDAENNALEYLWNPLECVWETKEIDGQMYTRASFQDRVWRYYDDNFNPLPIQSWMEEVDDDVIDVKDVDWTLYALRRRDDRVILENGIQSASSLMEWYIDFQPEIIEPIQKWGKWYIVVKYRQSDGNYDREDYDLFLLDSELNEMWEYPIWNIEADKIQAAVKNRLDKLVPVAA